MHELSIAMAIMDIVEQERQTAQAESVISIELEIGEQSGVVKEALEFAMESALKTTCFQQASFCIRSILAIAVCESCHNEFHQIQLYTPCPKCGSYATKLIRGRELSVKSIEVE